MSERYDSSSAQIEVFTRKAGLLSAVGHDLKLQATRFQLRVDAETRKVEATVDGRSLRVVAAIRGGREDTRVLSPADIVKIEQATAVEVLRTAQYPEVRFVGVLEDGRCRGMLTLCGHSEPLAVAIKDRTAEFIVHQPTFGIRPYTAMFGSLRVEAEVVVRVRLLS